MLDSKNLIGLLLLLAALAWPRPTFAESVVSSDANILQGNWRVGGTVGWGYSNYSGGAGTLNPRFSYFLADHFALGATLDFYFSPSYNSRSVGPVVTFYPWAEGSWAIFLEQEFQFERYSTSSQDSILSYTRAGLEYFVVPQVAVGPKLSYYRYVSGPFQTDNYFVSLNAGFAIFF